MHLIKIRAIPYQFLNFLKWRNTIVSITYLVSPNKYNHETIHKIPTKEIKMQQRASPRCKAIE